MQRLLKAFLSFIALLALVCAGIAVYLNWLLPAAAFGVAAFVFGAFAVRRRPEPQPTAAPAPQQTRPVSFGSITPRPGTDEIYKVDRSPKSTSRSDPEKKSVASTVAQDDTMYLVLAELSGLHTGAEFTANFKSFIAQHDLAPLSKTRIAQVAAKIDGKGLKAKHLRRTPGIALARKVRAELDPRYAGTSWVGGAPTLEGLPWPRAKSGAPMHHLAQIDLSTLPVALVPPGLPKEGGLAFFLATDEAEFGQGQVVYLPRIGTQETALPNDLSPIYAGKAQVPITAGMLPSAVPNRFPRWPVDLIALPLTSAEDTADITHVMEEMLPVQEPHSFATAIAKLPGADLAVCAMWDAGQRFAMSLMVAQGELDETVSRLKQTLMAKGGETTDDSKAIDLAAQAFKDFVAEVKKWAFAHKRWSLMSANDLMELQRLFAQVRTADVAAAPFSSFYTHSSAAFGSVNEALITSTITAASSLPKAFENLPDWLRLDIDTLHRLPTRGRWHQMLGRTVPTARTPEAHQADHLLLQLHDDPMLGWHWPDQKVVQFWIAPEALENGDWSAVKVAFAPATPLA